MSNSLAIAAVTSTVRYVLDRALQAPHAGQVGGAAVTTLHPSALGTDDLVTSAGINVFCFLATPNHAWNLNDLPTRRSDGSLAARPVAAVDLHYLVTCYGDDATLEPQRLLGRVVVALKTTAMLTRDVVAAALDLYADDPDTAFLAESDLAAEVELVKLSPTPLSLEEMSKLWGVLDSPYLLSQTYLATVVLVTAEAQPSLALPVLRRVIGVSPYTPPRIEEVQPQPAGSAAATGASLLVTGSGLLPSGDGAALVAVGPAELVPEPDARADAVRVVLNDMVPAGLHAVSIRHRAAAGPAGSPPSRIMATSNAVPLLLRPEVSAVSTGASTVTLTLAPPLQAGQRVGVQLSRLDDAGSDAPGVVSLVLPPVTAPSASVPFPRGDVPPGTWLVRVQVDGVDNLPGLIGEMYGAPTLTLP
ncbi:MAG TPA: DUF4255 domain-containing protein [Streptosporangiaceae bacterium]|nr:DUF4255 domain-containing protein [Streptosporangiaceae bacterium]